MGQPRPEMLFGAPSASGDGIYYPRFPAGDGPNPGVIEMVAASYEGDEETTIEFGVTRAQGSVGAVAIDWEIAGLIEGAPVVASGMLSWAAAEMGAKTVSVDLGTVTSDRTGTITLSNARSTTGGLAPDLGSSEADLTIHNVGGGVPQWDSGTIEFQLTQDQPVTAGLLDTRVTDPDGDDIIYAPAEPQISAPGGYAQGLPPGLTLTGSGLTGTPTVAGKYAYTIEASDVLNAELEWLARSQAPGVFYSNNFTFRNAAKTLLITSDAELRSSAAQLAGTTSSVIWDTVNKLSGNGSCRMNMPASSPGVYGGWHFSFDGIGLNTKNTSKHQFYFQFCYYAHSVYRNFYYGNPSTWGGKMAIVRSHDTSFAPGEVVIRRWNPPGGFISGYRYTGGAGSTTKQFRIAYNALGPDYAFNNFIDRSAPTVNSINAMQLRHGINYQSQGSTTGDDPDFQHAPRLVSNGWTVIGGYIDQVNDIVKIWTAPYGSAPELTMGAMSAGLPAVGTMDGSINSRQIYTGIQFTNYPNTATNWPSQDTFVCYGEAIASDNPIPFPGGYALPYAGLIVPPNYPPTGAVET